MHDEDGIESELQAMTQLRQILGALESPARRRVLVWATDVFSVQVEKVTQPDPQGEPGISPLGHDAFRATFAEWLELAEPGNNADRALIAAGWIQEKEGQASFDGRSINRLLKEHGVDVSNVTNALTSLIERRPRLAIQAGKKGKFEKLYRLTTEGRKAVRSMMRSEKDG